MRLQKLLTYRKAPAIEAEREILFGIKDVIADSLKLICYHVNNFKRTVCSRMDIRYFELPYSFKSKNDFAGLI